MPFVQATMGGGKSSLAELNDVNITTPEEGDLLVYDSESGKWINAASGPSTVTITLTIHGAKEDIISIYDSNDTLIGSCIFETGYSSGTFTTIVDKSYTDNWKFISDISKDPTNTANAFTKIQEITDEEEQTVNVFPDCIDLIYWFGRGTTFYAAKILTYYTDIYSVYDPSISNQINYVQVSLSVQYNGGGSVFANRTINSDGTLYIMFADSSTAALCSGMSAYNIRPDFYRCDTHGHTSAFSRNQTQVKTCTAVSGDRPGIFLTTQDQKYSNGSSGRILAMWLVAA